MPKEGDERGRTARSPRTPSEGDQKVPLLYPGVFGALAVIFSVSVRCQQHGHPREIQLGSSRRRPRKERMRSVTDPPPGHRFRSGYMPAQD